MRDATDPVMSWLAIMFALAVLAQFALATNHASQPVINWVVTALWVVFLVDFALKFALAPRKLAYLRHHWLQALMLAAPFLRALSVVRLARIGRLLPAARVVSASYRSAGTARQLVRGRIAYLAGLSSIAVVGIGELVYVVDGGPGTDFPTLSSAMLWSAATVLGMSPTITPKPALAQLVMLLGFVAGLVVITALAGVLGSFLVESRTERASTQETAPAPLPGGPPQP